MQRDDGPLNEIGPGDIVRLDAAEKHWHGAAPDCATTQIAIAEGRSGSAVEWMQKVTDARYAGGG